MKINSAGSTRLILVLGSIAIKVARSDRHCACNLFEHRIWIEATEARRAILCPVIACHPQGVILVMRAARPLTEDEFDQHDTDDTFPDWDYSVDLQPEPFEYKDSDWGILDGRLVALDYSSPAIPMDGGGGRG